MAKANKPKIRKKSKKREVKKLLTPFFEPQFWKRHLKESLIIFGLGIALYAMCYNYEYVLDDQIVITKNDFTKEGVNGIKDILTTESFTGYFGKQKNILAGSRYRPLSIITFALEYQFFGLNRKVSHIGNIILYGLLGLLIFRVLSLLFPIKEQDLWYFTIPFVATLLYVTHPVHSEVVANIKGRDELMTMIGALGLMYAVLHYVRFEKKSWLILSGVFMLLALLAKENALTFLAVVPITMYFFTDASIKKYAYAFIPTGVAIVIYFMLRYNAIGFMFGSPGTSNDIMNNPFINMTGGEKLATIFYTLGEYIRLLIFPHPLTHDYYPYHVPIMNWAKPSSILSFLMYAGLGIIALVGLRKKSILSYCILFYLMTLSIVSNLFVTVGTFMNERFLFISSLGFCIALAYLCISYLPKLLEKKNWSTYAGMAIIALFVVGFTVRTFTRVPVWKNALTLNGAAVTVSENSARSNCFFASALYSEARETVDANEKWATLEEAFYYIKKAVTIYPGYGSGNQMYAGILGERYKIDQDLNTLLNGFRGILQNRYKVEFIRDFTDYLLKRNVNQGMMAKFIVDAGYEIIVKQHGDLDAGMEYLQKGLKKYPKNALINFGVGKTFERIGNTTQAQKYLDVAYQKNPNLRNKE